MTNNTRKRDIAYAMDEFIRSTGGNLDPRANDNRVRRELKKFYHAIKSLEKDFYDDAENSHTMDAVIEEKLTGSDWVDRTAVKVSHMTICQTGLPVNSPPTGVKPERLSTTKPYNPAANL